MSDSDESLLTAAKLREQLDGDLAGGPDALPSAPLAADSARRSMLSFVDSVVSNWQATDLAAEVRRDTVEAAARRGLDHGDDRLLSHLVGVTEADVSGDRLTFLSSIIDRLTAPVPTFATAFGNPNTGKTNTSILLINILRETTDDLLVISNLAGWSGTDRVVTSAHDLAVTLLEHRDTPKAVLIDEASTHLDARTYSREVSNQYTPLAKRYAKIDVALEAVVCHTGKDLHPERKRLTNLALEKTDPETATFYSEWDGDADAPENRLFGGPVDDLEEAVGYDPDDAATWRWDLQPEAFSTAVGWDELLEELRDRGPAT